MKYILEDIIRFNTDDGTLTHLHTDDNIPLASSGCILLEYLIHHQGAVVTRNRLLDDIFKKNELVDSNSNLSQNISMLRKGFRDLGIDKDILVTKPRIGLLLPENVKITPDTHDPPQVMQPERGRRTFSMPSYKMIIPVVVMFFLGLYQLQISRVFSHQISAGVELISGCKVYVMNSAENARARVAELLKKEAFTCSDRDLFYFLENDKVSVLFESLVHCHTSPGRPEVCQNYLFREVN